LSDAIVIAICAESIATVYESLSSRDGTSERSPGTNLPRKWRTPSTMSSLTRRSTLVISTSTG
jgi:hypothetical protein